MPRKGQRFKVRRVWRKKPPAAPRNSAPDPLAHHPMLAYMQAHFEAALISGLSPHTIMRSRIAIRRFITWCNERGLQQPSDISRQVLERYQRHLFYYRKPDGTPLTTGSQLGCLMPLKAWFKWLARENHILYSPAADLQLPRKGRRLPRAVLSVQEVEAILSQADVDAPGGLRDRALLETLYSTALRRMEAAGLAVYDIDFTRRVVMVREGKGRRDRVTPIGRRALAWLDKYLLEARPQLLGADHEALFVNDYGQPATPEFIAERVRKYMYFAGIDKPGATHLLRHACATHMLEGGADIRFLQAMLGHANLDTTQIYTHVAIDKLQAIHEATHPARLHRTQEAATTDKPQDEARTALQNLLAAEE